MKIAPGAAAQFCETPPDSLTGALLHGDDPGLARLRRAALLRAALGEAAEAEMRLTELTGAAIRSDGAALDEALRAQSFFPGRSGVVVTEANDGLTARLTEGLRVARETGGLLVALAGTLPAASKLRKLFEGSDMAAAIPCRHAPLDRASLTALLSEQGVAAEEDALGAILAAADGLDALAARGLAERIALYKLGDPAPLTAQEAERVAGAGGAAEIEQALEALAARQAPALRRALARLWAQGVSPHAVATAAARRFRALHEASASPDGAEAALSRMRPPFFGPRRAEAARQAARWKTRRLEIAFQELLGLTDRLRETGGAEPQVLVEQGMLDLATRRF